MPLGHWLRGSIRTPTSASRARAAAWAGFRDVGVDPLAGAVVAPAARCRGVVVKSGLEVGHPAFGGAEVAEHRVLLALPGEREPFVAFRVVVPRLVGTGPATGDTLHGAVDVEDLEQQLQPRAPDVDDGLQSGGGHGFAAAQCLQDGVGVDLPGHRRRGEVAPDVNVLGAGEQQDIGVVGGATGAADLLVVRDR